MRKPLTARQKAYRKYLLTDHWKNLRERALIRDGRKCVECGIAYRVEVHHEIYRDNLEDTQLEDLKSLCKIHHRKAHGLRTMDCFDLELRRLQQAISREWLPSENDLKLLVSLISEDSQNEEMRAFLRSLAGYRIMKSGADRWKSWLAKPKDVHFRLWPWASRRLKTIQNQKVETQAQEK